MNVKVLKETSVAYCDSSDMPWEKADGLRNLHFRASEPVDKEHAVEIMTVALCVETPETEGYNNFHPSLLSKLPKDSKVWLAREGSVCVYVQTETPPKSLSALCRKMKADECDFDNGEIRIWWD